MVQTPLLQLTVAEYLHYDDGTDNRYELVCGELVAMPPPMIQHLRVAKFLERIFDHEIERLALNWESLREAGQRIGPGTARLPDVVVVSKQDSDRLLNQSTIFETPVLLAVEIVSTNWRDDYLHKLAEYEALGIPEYWIVDYLALGATRYLGSPKQPTISVYQLKAGEYQIQQFRNQDRIISTTFPELQLTAMQIWATGPSAPS